MYAKLVRLLFNLTPVPFYNGKAIVNGDNTDTVELPKGDMVEYE